MTPPEASSWFANSTELCKFKKNKHILTELIVQTEFLPESASAPQRLWHIIAETMTIPTCKQCTSQVSWDRRYKQYKTYCSSPACVNNDPDIILKKRSSSNYMEQSAKRKLTNLSRYGHTNYLATTQGKISTHEGKLTNSGPDYRLQEKSAREITIQSKYGVSNYFSLNINHSETKIEKYGSVNNLQKRVNTNTLLYGIGNPTQVPYVRYKGMFDNPDWLLDQHVNHQQSFSEIASNVGGIDPTALINRVRTKYADFVPTRFPVSTGEKQLSAALTDLNIEHTTNTRQIIPPLELDIFIPQHNIAIEYCGLYWHSEQKGKTRSYHSTKWKRCNELGIQLLTIYEDEWFNTPQLVLNKIAHLCGLHKSKIFARNTEVTIVTNNRTKKKFFNDTHLQGDGPGSITYSLIHNNKDVAMMTFIKQQSTSYVLSRYSTSIHVVGGFSKLLNYFKKHNSWTSIISFADLRWSDGNMYAKNGFILDSIIPPDYYYSPDGHTRNTLFALQFSHSDKVRSKTFNSLGKFLRR